MNNKPGQNMQAVVSAKKPIIKYDPKFVAEVDKYIKLSANKKLPYSIKGFAQHIGVTEETVKAWANKTKKDEKGSPTKEFVRPEFLKAVKKLLTPRDKKGRITRGVPQDTNKNGTAGRPTKYDPKFPEELILFFNIPPNFERELDHYDKGEVKWTDVKLMTNKLPTFLKFAEKIGVADYTLQRWAEEIYPDNFENKELRGRSVYPEFCVAYARAKEFQKYFIIENGLNGLYNPQFAIFVAKNITDMKDKQEQDVNVKGELVIKQISYKDIKK